MTKRRAIIGTAAIAGANALRLAAQFLILPIIARMLGPEAYGIVAYAGPFVFFLLIFGDLGLTPVLVRAKEVSPELESTIFWVAAAMGAALAILLAMLAFPIGHFLGRPEVSPILLSFCPLFVLVTLAAVPTARMQRGGKGKSAAAVEIASAFTGMAAALFGSLSGWGAWSLVAQQLGLWLCRLVLLLAITRFRPRLIFRFSLVKSSFGFGAGFAGANLIGFLSGNLDNILVGTFLGTAELGRYAIAYQIVNIPSLVMGAAYFALFPAIAEAHRDGGTPSATYREAVRVMLLIAAPVSVGLALIADLLVALVLGDAWMPVGGLIQRLTPVGLLNAVFVLNAALLLGLGRSDLEFRAALMRAGCATAGILAGLRFGTGGVAIGLSIGTAVAGAFYTRAVIGACGISIRALWDTVKAPLVSCAVLLVGVLALRISAFEQMRLLFALLLSIASGGLIYMGTLFVGFRSAFLEDFVTIRAVVAKKQLSGS